jgi:NAD(P)-dependent dehydrogenase (short-subunit alcohol dehydrogenase family)
MNHDLLDFSGKIVLITGGSTGIGRATAVAFARHGANVAIGDVNEDEAYATLDHVKNEGVDGLFIKADMARSSDIKNMVEKTLKIFGGLDCAFNNAGIMHDPMMIDELDEKSFDRVIAVDLKGVFLCMKYQLQHMLGAGKGAIVNTASVAGLMTEAGSAAYVAAKHGVIGLTRTAAIENAHRGIRINALAPGWVHTQMSRDWDEDKELNAKLKVEAPMHRGAQPEEMTGMVLFLCSDAASFATGQTFILDGGQTVRGLLPVEVEFGADRPQEMKHAIPRPMQRH